MEHIVLVINPGSTSTKLAVYRDERQTHTTSLHHSNQDLARFSDIEDQKGFREKVIVEWLESEDIPLESLTAIVARGGLLAPMPGGTYHVNEVMVQHMAEGRYGRHASNLAGLIAYDLSQRLGIPAFIVDPVVVDELDPVARISGNPQVQRISIFHALNQRANGKKAALLLGRPYEELNLIIAHLGGGISVGAHKKGRVVDVNNALSGEGPFSPERVGSLPSRRLVHYFFDQHWTKGDLMKLFVGRSGLVAHLGTNDSREIVARMHAGDADAKFYFQAMCYQIAKEIGRASTVFCGNVDQIVLTGGLAHSTELVEELKPRVEFIAPVVVLPGENELEALAFGALRVLRGEEQARHYAVDGNSEHPAREVKQ
ncbi:MAG TPA: butyrate kinase [Firmicutes bacterium]|nr:butyrate kinase [Bacillota bacterium]HHT42842.1 butyrate kinase [Bacillota bacterium]